LGVIAAPEPFWRLDDPEVDDDGTVRLGGMWRHQREWWQLPNFIRGLVTGYGGGKTLALAKRMIWLAWLNRPVPAMTISPTYPMAETTIVEQIKEALDGKCQGTSTTFRLMRSQPYRFEIRRGRELATIRCASGEKPDRLKGPNIGPIGIDEPFLMERAVFDQALARCRHPAAKLLEINVTGTPEGVVGWGYDLFEGELRARHDVGLVQCSSRENLALPTDYVDRLEAAYDDQAREAYVDGRFVNLAAGRVYHSFDPAAHVVAAPKPTGADVCVGMDFNVDPFAFVMFWRHGDRMHVFHEEELRNTDSEEAAETIRRRWPDVRKVYPDASGRNRQSAGGGGGRSAFAYMEAAGLVPVCRAANPRLVDRRNAVNGAFRHGRVTIAPECKRLRQYLLAYTHARANATDHKAMSHLLDAMGYPIAYLFPVDRHNTRLVRFAQ
jgi:hypothetical protein